MLNQRDSLSSSKCISMKNKLIGRSKCDFPRIHRLNHSICEVEYSFTREKHENIFHWCTFVRGWSSRKHDSTWKFNALLWFTFERSYIDGWCATTLNLSIHHVSKTKTTSCYRLFHERTHTCTHVPWRVLNATLTHAQIPLLYIAEAFAARAYSWVDRARVKTYSRRRAI